MSPHKELTKYDLQNIFKNPPKSIADTKAMQEAESEFEKFDFPDKKTESWKHTDIRPILRHGFSKPQSFKTNQKYIDNLTVHQLDAQKLVFTNGEFDAQKSEITDNNALIALPLQEAKEKYPKLFKKYFNKAKSGEKSIFSSLNTAYAQNGFFICIKKGKSLERPVHIMNFTDGNNQKTACQYRNIIVTEKNTQAKIINSYHSLSEDYSLNNILTEIFTEKNALLEYYLFQGEGNDAFQIHETRVMQQEKSHFSCNTVTLCGALVRNNLWIELQGEHSETDLSGLYLPDKEQHFDNFVHVHHARPNCNSSQVYRGIIDNNAEAVFLGKVLVAKDAQKTNAEQSNKNILLSDYAKAHSKPQLEIYADDVACAHGSTTGQINKEALFYLRSRGISEKHARMLMLGAFASVSLDKIKLKPYREFVNFLVNKRLKGEEVTGLCNLKICPSC